MECPGVFCCPAYGDPGFNTNPHSRTIPHHETRRTLCFTQLRSLETESVLFFAMNSGITDPLTSYAKSRAQEGEMTNSRWNQAILSVLAVTAATTLAQTQGTPRPGPPTRDPNTPGFVTAKELPDGQVPPVNVEGNFIIGPTHTPSPETVVKDGVPQGTVIDLKMSSADSKIYSGIARDPGTSGTPDPNDPAKLIVTTSRPAPYTRNLSIYVPKQYVPGTEAPFIVGADGPDRLLFTVLDNLIAEKRVPV